MPRSPWLLRAARVGPKSCARRLRCPVQPASCGTVVAETCRDREPWGCMQGFTPAGPLAYMQGAISRGLTWVTCRGNIAARLNLGDMRDGKA